MSRLKHDRTVTFQSAAPAVRVRGSGALQPLTSVMASRGIYYLQGRNGGDTAVAWANVSLADAANVKNLQICGRP